MGTSRGFGLLNGIRSVGFFGLGKSTLAIAGILPKGTKITLRSEGNIVCEKLPRTLRGARIFDGAKAFDSVDEDILFLSPSVRRERPEFDALTVRSIRFCSDLELFLSEFRGLAFAVSGSDGKSTTATLTALMLGEKFSGISAIGNIGVPFCSAAHSSTAVLELSSFNLRYATPRAKRAAITNITPNHLNWHSDFEEYKAAKLSLLDAADEAVISADDDLLIKYSEKKELFALTSINHSLDELKGRFRAELYFTAECGAVLRNGEPIIPISELRRHEAHNLKNFLTAMALSEGYTSREHLCRVAREFCGLAHRCEQIAFKDGVSYINSSIDTTPHRTAQTLSSLAEAAILILGGRTKVCDFTVLREQVSKKVSLAVITGECRREIADALRGCCDIAVIDGFEDAVIYSSSVAKSGDTVLLSPAATSYDEFSSFEERGEKFKEIIKEIQNTSSKQTGV